MRPRIIFVCQEPGALFLFETQPGIKTAGITRVNGWEEPDAYGGNHVFMTMREPPISPYLNPPEKVKPALREALYAEYKTVLTSVEGGFLTIGYYNNGDHETVGYMHSATPLKLAIWTGRAKDIPPSWFKLKLFC